MNIPNWSWVEYTFDVYVKFKILLQHKNLQFCLSFNELNSLILFNHFQYSFFILGANMFAGSYSPQIYTIDGNNQEPWSIYLRSNTRSRFTKNEVIYIKDILLHNFRINEPFIKIPRNSFLVTNSSSSYSSRNYFYLEVIIFQ